MKVDLSSQDINTLIDAMKIWERDSMSNAMMNGLVGAMLCSKVDQEKYKNDLEKEMDLAKKDANNRENKSVMIRAKLIQALNRQSEQIDEPVKEFDESI